MTSPPKKRVAVLEPPKAKPAGEYFACTHSATRAEVMPDGHIHHARPETVERRRLNGYRLAKLGMCSNLSKWEANFVQSVSQRNRLTHRQQEIVDRLVATHLEGGLP